MYFQCSGDQEEDSDAEETSVARPPAAAGGRGRGRGKKGAGGDVSYAKLIRKGNKHLDLKKEILVGIEMTYSSQFYSPFLHGKQAYIVPTH